MSSTARCSRMYAAAGTGPRSSRSSTTRAKPGQRASRSAAPRATRRRPPQRTQSRAERSAPAAAADAGSRASVASTKATCPAPAVVMRAMRARSRLLAPEEREPTISLSRPGGNNPSRPSRPSILSRSHPGGGEDLIGTPIGTDYTSPVEYISTTRYRGRALPATLDEGLPRPDRPACGARTARAPGPRRPPRTPARRPRRCSTPPPRSVSPPRTG